MTVEQLDVIITANSDDLETKLAEVNDDLVRLEQNALAVSAVGLGALQMVADSVFDADWNYFNSGFSVDNLNDFSDYDIQYDGTYSVDNTQYDGVDTVDSSDDLQIQSYEYDNNNAVANNSFSYNDIYNDSITGKATADDLIGSGIIRSFGNEKQSDNFNRDYADTRINIGDTRIVLEVDGDVLAETVLKNQNSALLRTNGMLS